MVGVSEIQEILPHRYPFLLVDRILEIELGKRVVGVKNVTINEPFFAGHFPGHPIMPGVLILEAMAQVGGFLLMRSLTLQRAKTLLYFTGIDRARFRRPVVPGDQIRFEVSIAAVAPADVPDERRRAGGWKNRRRSGHERGGSGSRRGGPGTRPVRGLGNAVTGGRPRSTGAAEGGGRASILPGCRHDPGHPDRTGRSRRGRAAASVGVPPPAGRL